MKGQKRGGNGNFDRVESKLEVEEAKCGKGRLEEGREGEVHETMKDEVLYRVHLEVEKSFFPWDQYGYKGFFDLEISRARNDKKPFLNWLVYFPHPLNFHQSRRVFRQLGLKIVAIY